MLRGYYDDVASREATTIDGWRSALIQRLRYEVVRRVGGLADGDSILDLGCGTGGLAEYLRGEWDGPYRGIDGRALSPAGAPSYRQDDDFQRWVGDLFKDRRLKGVEADLVCAIGAQIDGKERAPAARRRHMWRLLDRVDDLSAGRWVVILLDQGYQSSGQPLRLDPCLQGIDRAELEGWARCREVSVIADNRWIPGEWVVASGSGATRLNEQQLLTLYRQVLQRVEGLSTPTAVEKARYWMHLHRWELAAEAIDAATVTSRELDLLRRRLRLCASDRSVRPMGS